MIRENTPFKEICLKNSPKTCALFFSYRNEWALMKYNSNTLRQGKLYFYNSLRV